MVPNKPNQIKYTINWSKVQNPYLLAAGRGAKYCDKYVCLSVSARMFPHRLPNFRCMLTVAATQIFGYNISRYKLPVLAQNRFTIFIEYFFKFLPIICLWSFISYYPSLQYDQRRIRWSAECATLCVCMSVSVPMLLKENNLSYQHQSWYIVHGSRSACIDPEVKRSKVKVASDVLPVWMYACWYDCP